MSRTENSSPFKIILRCSPFYNHFPSIPSRTQHRARLTINGYLRMQVFVALHDAGAASASQAHRRWILSTYSTDCRYLQGTRRDNHSLSVTSSVLCYFALDIILLDGLLELSIVRVGSTGWLPKDPRSRNAQWASGRGPSGLCRPYVSSL